MNLRSTEWSREEERKKKSIWPLLAPQWLLSAKSTQICRHKESCLLHCTYGPPWAKVLFVITAADPWQDAVPPNEWLKIKHYINSIVFQEAKAQSHYSADLWIKCKMLGSKCSDQKCSLQSQHEFERKRSDKTLWRWTPTSTCFPKKSRGGFFSISLPTVKGYRERVSPLHTWQDAGKTVWGSFTNANVSSEKTDTFFWSAKLQKKFKKT